MTSRERMMRCYEHKEADRIPMTDSPWQGTLNRWRSEGLTEEAWEDRFGFDRITFYGGDNSPRFPVRVVEETDTHITKTTEWGVTLRYIKGVDSTPEFLHFEVTDPDSWRKIRDRMTPSRDRIDWGKVERNYKLATEKGLWRYANFWFGFDITHSWFVGTETLLIAIAEEPEWCAEMFNRELDVNIALIEMMLDAGYEFDGIQWPDDMGFKQNQFFSLNTYRELLKPVQKRACDWAHAHNLKVHLHSCGDINPFVPELIEIGVDALNPLEVKAGMDPVALKKKFGDKLVLHGGINAVKYEETEAFIAEMEKVIPAVKENGGYIFSSDHSIPNNVSLAEMTAIAEAAMRLGKY
ncbi:MAG TPA: uroporphyrinogen decarboxylase family protein [Clostridiales bacterium]|nr:uroporphyrinogen decarboxylase family protein [Clostridiales bacterium]